MKKKWLANVVVVFGCSAILLAGCGKAENKINDVTDADVEKAMAVVWHEFDEGNNYDITTERTYKQYLSGLKYDEKLQEPNKLSDETIQGKMIYLQADVVSVLVEGEGWDSVVEYPDYGYWLVQEDGDTGFQIVEKGY